MLILNPDLAVAADIGSLIIEDSEIRLTFEGESASACKEILTAIPRTSSLISIARETGYSMRTVQSFTDILQKDGLAIDTTFPGECSPAEYLAKIRQCALFWNKHIMAQHFPLKLFGGEATKNEVLGWGIEFYFFVRAAREYMALGSGRTTGSTEMLAPVWDHFADEAFHCEIFLNGLVACGLGENTVRRRLPMPTTRALINHLFETSQSSLLEYTTLFALMQPLTRPVTHQEVKQKYDFLREKYPFAAGLFDAFQTHDGIDVTMEHSKLTLESVLEHRGVLGRAEWHDIMKVLENTANTFILFFEGIQKCYRSSFDLRYRQIPNAARAFG